MFLEALKGSKVEKMVKMGDFFHFQISSKWLLNDLQCWNTLFLTHCMKPKCYWLSARSASTLIKPQAIWILNFTRANGRWRTLVKANKNTKTSIGQGCWNSVDLKVQYFGAMAIMISDFRRTKVLFNFFASFSTFFISRGWPYLHISFKIIRKICALS